MWSPALEQRGDGEMHRRHAARGADRADAAFQRGEPLLEHRRRRVGDARIDVAGAFEVEQRGGVIGVLEHVRGGLVDRHGARAGRRIGVLAGVQAQRLEGGRFRSRHAVILRGRRAVGNATLEKHEAGSQRSAARVV